MLLLALSLGLTYGSARLGCPLLAIFGRWSRWILISVGIATVITQLGISSRPFWALSLFCFLLWFLLETLYNWVAIDALSRSSMPLFPTFRENPRGNEWPASKRFIQLREDLRKLGLNNTTSLVAMLEGDIVMRSPIYETEDKKTRVQVLFLPHQSGVVQVSFVITSVTESGKRIVTDNFFLPFGGFYPENTLTERRPWMRSIHRLMKRHEERVDAIGEDLIPLTTDPELDLNEQQRELERENIRLGFLAPAQEREELGKITREGRYRVWKELWMLSYLGRSRKY